MKKNAPVDYTDSIEHILLMVDTYQMLMKEDSLDEEGKDLLGKTN
jgi:hypothetical protein